MLLLFYNEKSENIKENVQVFKSFSLFFYQPRILLLTIPHAVVIFDPCNNMFIYCDAIICI